MRNPLIADCTQETIQNASEALNALMALLAPQHSGICRLLEPIAHAIEHAADSES